MINHNSFANSKKLKSRSNLKKSDRKCDKSFVISILEVMALLISVFSPLFWMFIYFFKILVLKSFKISLSLLSFSRYEVFLFFCAFLTLFCFFLLAFSLKIKGLKQKSFGDICSSVFSLFYLLLVLAACIFLIFYESFYEILAIFIFLFLFSLFLKIDLNDFSRPKNILILFLTALFSMMWAPNLFINNYLKHFICYEPIVANNSSQIIDVVIAYHDNKPIIKQYDTTKNEENYLNNFLPGYEYDGEKHPDASYGMKSLNFFNNKK